MIPPRWMKEVNLLSSYRRHPLHHQNTGPYFPAECQVIKPIIWYYCLKQTQLLALKIDSNHDQKQFFVREETEPNDDGENICQAEKGCRWCFLFTTLSLHNKNKQSRAIVARALIRIPYGKQANLDLRLQTEATIKCHMFFFIGLLNWLKFSRQSTGVWLTTTCKIKIPFKRQACVPPQIHQRKRVCTLT